VKHFKECIAVSLTIIGLAVGLKILLTPRIIEIKPNAPQTSQEAFLAISTAQAQEIAPSPSSSKPAPVTTASIKAYVESQAKKYGVNPQVTDFIITHESAYNPAAVGDHGTSFGLAQIHLPAHPDITKAQALDYKFSTAFLLKEILAGRISEWSSWNHKNDWYQNNTNI
jgi:soluble lytic murein transglycosylase-like protein